MDTSEPSGISNKKVTDIWSEILEEKQRFRKVIGFMGFLVAFAALIGLAMFYFSYRTLNEQEARYENRLEAIEVRMEVARGDATRARQSVLNQTLAIREELTRAAEAASIAEQVRTAAETGVTAPLVADALLEARQYTVGARLDQAREKLIEIVYLDQCNPAPQTDAALTLPQCALLHAVLADWAERDNRNITQTLDVLARLDVNTPPPLVANYQAIILAETEAGTSALIPYAHAGLAQLYYAYADNNQLGRDADCVETIRASTLAEETGIDGIGPYLVRGHCLRKQGKFDSAHETFLKAKDWYERADAAGNYNHARMPSDLVRWAYHGAGTTQTAVIASQVSTGSGLDEFQIKSLGEARADLEEAAGLREKRGEGAVGRVYTSENIGFIYLIEQDWDGALAHTHEVNQAVPLAWNLIVRRIAAGELFTLHQAAGDRPAAQRVRAIACEAERVLTGMRYEYFDEGELLKLLPDNADYELLVRQIVALPRQAYETQTRSTSQTAEYSTDLCMRERKTGLLPF